MLASSQSGSYGSQAFTESVLGLSFAKKGRQAQQLAVASKVMGEITPFHEYCASSKGSISKSSPSLCFQLMTRFPVNDGSCWPVLLFSDLHTENGDFVACK